MNQLISPEVVNKIRREQTDLMLTVEQLRGQEGSPGLRRRLQKLEQALREHIFLVGAVLDAVGEDDVANRRW